jgi:hypothetical protein
MTPKFAHTRKVEPWQTMEEHLGEVAKHAACFASAFDSGAWGELAGFWHDLGKYADDFQSYLRVSAGDPVVEDASIVDGWKGGRVDHSTAGAVLVHERVGANFPRIETAIALAMVTSVKPSGRSYDRPCWTRTTPPRTASGSTDSAKTQDPEPSITASVPQSTSRDR